VATKNKSLATRPENDEGVIEQARAWLLRSRSWDQRGLDRLANAEEVLRLAADPQPLYHIGEHAGFHLAPRRTRIIT
jgi:hypothetical protein